MSSDKEGRRKGRGRYRILESKNGKQIVVPSLLRRQEVIQKDRCRFEKDEEEEDFILGDEDFMKELSGKEEENSVVGKSFSEERTEYREVTSTNRNKMQFVSSKVCEICDKVLKTKRILNSHMRYVHSAERVKCKLCDTVRKNSNSMRRHVYTSHAAGETSECDPCDLSFKRIDLWRHFKKVHMTRIINLPDVETSKMSHKMGENSTKENDKDLEVNVLHESEILEGGDSAKGDCEGTFSHSEDNGIANEDCNMISDEKVDGEMSTEQPLFKITDVRTKSKDCKICPKTFRNRACLKQHVAFCHGPDQKLLCPLCKKSFRNRISLRQHVKCVHKKDDRCPYCECRANRMHMLQHVRKKHPKEAQDFCTRRGKSLPFSPRSEVCRHDDKGKDEDEGAKRKEEEEEETTTFPCKTCGMSCLTRGGLSIHAFSKHGIDMRRKRTVEAAADRVDCAPCGKSIRRGLMRVHVRRVHDKVRDFVCHVCGESFYMSSHLRRHQSRHHEGYVVIDDRNRRIFPCDVCGQVCRTRWGLGMHRNAKHWKDMENDDDRRLREDPLGCDKCRKRYGTRAGLIKHVSVKHGGRWNDSGTSEIEVNVQQKEVEKEDS